MTYVAGSTFGEIGILLTKRWQLDVRAATNVEVLAMSRRSMFKVFSEFPNAREDLVNITKERLRRIRERLSKEGLQDNICDDNPRMHGSMIQLSEANKKDEVLHSFVGTLTSEKIVKDDTISRVNELERGFENLMLRISKLKLLVDTVT